MTRFPEGYFTDDDIEDTVKTSSANAARSLLAGLAALLACSMGLSTASPAKASGYVRLDRAAHPLASPELDRGRLAGTKVLHNMSLVFKLTAAQEADREALLTEIQRPGSPSYHRWLTPEQYAARFGAGEETVARATAWLASQGFTVHGTSALGARVTFTGTVAQVEAAFRTELHAYDVNGERHFAMARPPSVPAEIADRVLNITNTHDFYPRHPKTEFRVVPQPDATCPAGDVYCSGNGIGPPDWAFIYNVNALYSPGIGGTPITGAGVTIAVVGITDVAQADLTSFRTRYGLAVNNITKTLVPNTGAPQAANGAGLEAALDVEWAGAIAPAATIDYVYTGANDQNVFDAVFYAIEHNYGGVLSVSWGGCEMGAAPADADLFQVYGAAAALEGISFIAAAGDSGAADCQGKGGLYVNIPASYPQVTAVGGTGFSKSGGLTFTAGTVSAVGTEQVWNEFHNAYSGGVSATGGGISSVFSRPLYQSAIPTCAIVGSLPTPVIPANQRQIPDVSFTAGEGSTQYGTLMTCTLDPAVSDCTNTGATPQVIQIGGTSAPTPAFAGVVALANQATGGRLGNINPLLYATSASVPAAFHDITTGNNEVTCHSGVDPGCPAGLLYGFAAASGYDCASGLGSVNATSLVSAWAGLTPTTTAIGAVPINTTEGGSVNLSATVNVNGVNAHNLAGIVSFVFRSHLTNQVLDLSWNLGDVTITNGTTTAATVFLTTAIPPGMVQPSQSVDVYAQYNGDANHLPSFSGAKNIVFAPVTLCISPPTTSVAAGATVNYTAAGGVPPLRWYIYYDTTCNVSGAGCTFIDISTGVLTAGNGAPGYVIVGAVDADGAETFSEVTVAGGSGTVPWSPSGPSNYAGILPGGGPPAAVDAGLHVAQSGGVSSISWNVPPTATSSDILRGLVSGLPVGPGGGDETCLASAVASPTSTFNDATNPAAGACFWYVVRGSNACGRGPWGAQSNGIPETSATCP